MLKGGTIGWKKVPCWVWMSFKVKVLWWILQQRLSISLCWQQIKGVFCVKEFFIELGEFPRMLNTMKLHFHNVSDISSSWGIKVSPIDQIYIQSHLIREWVMRVDAKTCKYKRTWTCQIFWWSLPHAKHGDDTRMP